MKKFLILILPLLFVASALKAQTTTGHCYGEYYIDDPSYSFGDYYDVTLVLITGYPSQHQTSLPTQYVQGQNVSFSNIIFTNVPYPRPVPPGYYSFYIIIYKNGTTGPYSNSSYATPSVINDGNTRFDAITDPIVVVIK